VNGGEDGKQKTVIEFDDVQKSLENISVHKGTIKEGSIEVGNEQSGA
jgi:alanyl-tRNA synthetase